VLLSDPKLCLHSIYWKHDEIALQLYNNIYTPLKKSFISNKVNSLLFVFMEIARGNGTANAPSSSPVYYSASQ
jgi:hypothetical protein